MKRLLLLPLAFALLVSPPLAHHASAAQKKKTAKPEPEYTPVPPAPKTTEPEGRSLADAASSAVSTVIGLPGKILSPLLPFKSQNREPLTVNLTGIPKIIESTQSTRINFSADVINQGKKPISLDFESNLRVTASIVLQSGETISSTAYVADTTPDPTSLTVNPTEKVRYDLSLTLEKPIKGSLYTVKVKLASENIPLEAKADILAR
jgi:hypothetical protein